MEVKAKRRILNCDVGINGPAVGWMRELRWADQLIDFQGEYGQAYICVYRSMPSRASR